MFRMIFNEIYGCYYNAVAKIISLAIDGALTEKEMRQVAASLAFDESMLSIVPAIRKQEWQLIDENFNTPIKEKPSMPLTTLEKRWLKTILLDSRISLFQIPTEELEDVEPLFCPEDVVYFDRYLDGDKYTDTTYITNFRIIMQAIRERRKVKVWYCSRKNKEWIGTFLPVKMEYSDKEDKFRILAAGSREIKTVNMGRILKCELLKETFSEDAQLPIRSRETLVFDLTDTRNTLERAMMKFAHYKKQVERTGENTYRVELEYDRDDETDVVIQIMTFGSCVNVISPETVRKELSDRISKQLLWWLTDR